MAATNRNNMLSATDRDAALGRIGCADMRGRASVWRIVNWFVQLARDRKPFREMAPVEVELLRQEYRALQESLRERTGALTENVVSIDALEQFRSGVRTHLEELADTGQTRFGPFTLERVVYMPRPNTSLPQQVYSGDLIDPFDGQGLLYHLSRLIDQLGLAILRCPHCQQIFLRPRADAEYCSRPCQANAHANRRRKAEKTKKLQSRRNTRKGRRQLLLKPKKSQVRSGRPRRSAGVK